MDRFYQNPFTTYRKSPDNYLNSTFGDYPTQDPALGSSFYPSCGAMATTDYFRPSNTPSSPPLNNLSSPSRIPSPHGLAISLQSYSSPNRTSNDDRVTNSLGAMPYSSINQPSSYSDPTYQTHNGMMGERIDGGKGAHQNGIGQGWKRSLHAESRDDGSLNSALGEPNSFSSSKQNSELGLGHSRENKSVGSSSLSSALPEEAGNGYISASAPQNSYQASPASQPFTSQFFPPQTPSRTRSHQSGTGDSAGGRHSDGSGSSRGSERRASGLPIETASPYNSSQSSNCHQVQLQSNTPTRSGPIRPNQADPIHLHTFFPDNGEAGIPITIIATLNSEWASKINLQGSAAEQPGSPRGRLVVTFGNEEVEAKVERSFNPDDGRMQNNINVNITVAAPPFAATQWTSTIVPLSINIAGLNPKEAGMALPGSGKEVGEFNYWLGEFRSEKCSGKLMVYSDGRKRSKVDTNVRVDEKNAKSEKSSQKLKLWIKELTNSGCALTALPPYVFFLKPKSVSPRSSLKRFAEPLEEDGAQANPAKQSSSGLRRPASYPALAGASSNGPNPSSLAAASESSSNSYGRICGATLNRSFSHQRGVGSNSPGQSYNPSMHAMRQYRSDMGMSPSSPAQSSFGTNPTASPAVGSDRISGDFTFSVRPNSINLPQGGFAGMGISGPSGTVSPGGLSRADVSMTSESESRPMTATTNSTTMHSPALSFDERQLSHSSSINSLDASFSSMRRGSAGYSPSLPQGGSNFSPASLSKSDPPSKPQAPSSSSSASASASASVPKSAATPANQAQKAEAAALVKPGSRAVLQMHGELQDMAVGWSHDEYMSSRRLVQFWRRQDGTTIHCTFRPILPHQYVQNSIVVSCIFREDKNECFITSVDLIYLLEALVASRFTVEEKNRIRRNLEGFKPSTVAKGKSDSSEFFKIIMDFPNPKPRNIEKDVKVFPWSVLGKALTKIIGKYSAAPTNSSESTNLSKSGAKPPSTDPAPKQPRFKHPQPTVLNEVTPSPSGNSLGGNHSQFSSPNHMANHNAGNASAYQQYNHHQQQHHSSSSAMGTVSTTSSSGGNPQSSSSTSRNHYGYDQPYSSYQ